MSFARNVFDAETSPARDRYLTEEAETEPTGQTPATAEQIIHWASARLQTEDFDDTIQQVYDLVERYHGFLQDSRILGPGQQRGDHPARRAEFTIRVPAASYQAVLHALDGIGTLDALHTTATNVTTQYADINARLHALRVQEERILALLERADTLADVIALEARLSELIFQIERFTSERQNLRRDVAYSTIELSIREVEEIERLPNTTAGAVFAASLRAMQTFGFWLVLFFAAVIPWVLVLGIIAFPLWYFLRRRWKKKAGKC